MLPDVSGALERWKVEVTLIRVTSTSADFVRTPVPTPTIIEAVVQPADKEQLKALTVDSSLRYLWVHYEGVLAVGEFILHQSAHYKIITVLDYIVSTENDEYGFFEVVCEEVKGQVR